MDRRVYLTVTVDMIIDIPEEMSVDEFIQEMDYNFSHEDVVIIDTTIEDFEVTDPK